jgi:hypothetical protein
MKQANLLILLFPIVSAGLHAQTGSPPAPQIPRDPPIYFYNPRLDGLGQDVQKAAGDLANGQIFDSQLANLEAISKLATDRIFSSARRAALAKLEGTRNWKSFCDRVETAKNRALPSDTQQAGWEKQIAILEIKMGEAQSIAKTASGTLKSVADLLEEVGKAQQVIEFGKILQARKVADITATDLRVVGKLQEAMDNLGTLLKGIASQPKPASTRSAAEQMKVDLAKAEIDHLKTLIQIEEKRLDGQHDVKDILTAIGNTLTCVKSNSTNPPSPGTWVCTLKFDDPTGSSTIEKLSETEEIEETIRRFRSDRLKLKTLVYLLENFAALAARADTPVRIAELRSAIEERRFAIRRDAIMARTYEQILLIGAQRIATYYKGGIKPETLAQFVNALSTAGLIPTIALK